MPFIDSKAIRRVEWRDGRLPGWFWEGERCDHADVPQRAYCALLASDSAGASFRNHIRGAYPCRKVRG